MNPRRVHELMLKNFPEFDAVKLAWENVLDLDGVRKEKLSDIIDKNISGTELLIEINRKNGNLLAKGDALDFLAQHVGKATIKITNREFSGFVVIVSNGVAAGWRNNA